MTELFSTEYFSTSDLLLLGLAVTIVNILIFGSLIGFVPGWFVNVGGIVCVALAAVPIGRAATREWKEQGHK